MTLLLKDIFTFAQCTTTSRSIVEGEQILNSNQIILCGKIEQVHILMVHH